MVVCKLTRITNRSSRSFFFVHAGDPLYSPRVNGTLCGEGSFDVPPGFDAFVEDLIVPWAALSGMFAGLVFGELGLSEEVRCVVGPGQHCWDVDWLRLHDSSWQPLLEDEWFLLGHRHLRGAIAPVEVHLTFRDADVAEAEATSGSLRIAQSMHFDHHIAGLPTNTVLLNVFDLAAATATFNAMFCNAMMKSFGAFHTAVEIYGSEFSFYQSKKYPESCGICKSRHPRQHPVHVFRQSIVMGTTKLTETEVKQKIFNMIADWPSGKYDLIHNNCIHFCQELLRVLDAEPVPGWVTGLHESIARAQSWFSANKSITDATSDEEFVDALESQVAARPEGAEPVQDEFFPNSTKNSCDNSPQLALYQVMVKFLQSCCHCHAILRKWRARTSSTFLKQQ